jgi:hypothetical protein
MSDLPCSGFAVPNVRCGTASSGGLRATGLIWGASRMRQEWENVYGGAQRATGAELRSPERRETLGDTEDLDKIRELMTPEEFEALMRRLVHIEPDDPDARA